MLGPVQLAWLKDRLATSTSPWKAVVTTVPFNPTVAKNRDSWQGYLPERQSIVDFIRAHDIHGVVFVSGDIHSGGAIDDGTNNSGFPELSIPLVNHGFANTGNTSMRWTLGPFTPTSPGFGWLTATETMLTMAVYGADGALRLTATVPAQ